MSAYEDLIWRLTSAGQQPLSGKWAARQVDAYQAEVLREAADWFVAQCPDANGTLALCMCHAADPLRHLADQVYPGGPR